MSRLPVVYKAPRRRYVRMRVWTLPLLLLVAGFVGYWLAVMGVGR
jgi:hypothetical protein